MRQTTGPTRIDTNDCSELVKVPIVFQEDIIDALCEAGVEVDRTLTHPRFKLVKAEPSGDATTTAAATLQWVASQQSIAMYVCFQIPIAGTHQQYNL